MRRLLYRTALCLIAGIVANVAVAWSLAWFTPGTSNTTLLFGGSGSDGRNWVVGRSSGVGWQHDFAFTSRTLTISSGEDRENGLQGVDAFSDPATDVAEVQGGGWPLAALVAHRAGLDDSEAEVARTGVWRSGLGPQAVIWQPWRWGWVHERTNAAGMPDHRVLPLRPAWPGFAINTLLFALVISIPFFISAWRRSWRRGRGCCPACGYDLRARPDDGCPECGWRRHGT